MLRNTCNIISSGVTIHNQIYVQESTVAINDTVGTEVIFRYPIAVHG